MKRPVHTLFGLLLIPTQSPELWQPEKYSGIPAHVLNFSQDGLLIRVKNSSSPLFYPLPETKKIVGFSVDGEFRGLPQFSKLTDQGEKGADDFALRVGFVIPGSKTLSGLKRMMAPAWVKNLYGKIPPGQGLDHVQFFNLVQNPALVTRQRVHPMSDLIQEDFVSTIDKPGSFHFNYTLKTPVNAVALWLSTDGDDTKSSFDVLVSKLQLVIEP